MVNNSNPNNSGRGKEATTPRLFLDSPLPEGQTVTLDKDQSHYLQNVMRVKPGDTLRLFNGKDGEWLAQIANLTKREVQIKIEKLLKPQKTEPDLWLCCAPIKKAHFEYMIEKATELGVAVIQPILTVRTQIREVNIERMRTIAIEAAEQSERMCIPDIKTPVTLNEFIKNFPADRKLIVCAEWGNAQSVQSAFNVPSMKSSQKAGILTGPEGGLAPEEMELFQKKQDTLFIRLGPRILRADTAAIAALTAWQAVCGDWQS